MQARDTIVAIATPLGHGGVGIVRVSGSQATAIAKAILGVVPNARRATFLPFLDENGDSLDQGIALYFSAPHSFTGEDVLELQAHGGPVVLDLILQRSLQLGCRLARPGEFSERAYLNDQLDLAQAEAVADLIESTTAAAARLAMRSLQGVFSREVHAVVEALVRLRMYVEAALDFPEEEIDFLADSRVNVDLQAIAEQLASIQARATQGRLMRDGMYLVIAGAPNVGKSSLLNALAGEDTAIVTDVPGTTRDVLRERIHIDGMPLHLIDTAGLRATEDQVEQEGIRRARAEIDKADLILWLMDASTDIASQLPTSSDLPEGIPVTLIHNKIDKLGRPIGLSVGPLGPEIALSVKTGDGLELLREHLKQRMGYQGVQEGGFMARRRHLDALARAADFVAAGRQALSAQGAPELLADDLRGAQQALGEITGEFSNEDLLDRIFTSFCIGK